MASWSFAAEARASDVADLVARSELFRSTRGPDPERGEGGDEGG